MFLPLSYPAPRIKGGAGGAQGAVADMLFKLNTRLTNLLAICFLPFLTRWMMRGGGTHTVVVFSEESPSGYKVVADII